jgi:hypothetical protein
MKTLSNYLIAVVCLLSVACKKSTDGPPDEIHRSLYYKVVATIPSPADEARGIFTDSLSLSSVSVNSTSDPTFLTNFPGVGANITGEYGFGIGYSNDNLPTSHFLLNNAAFQTVPLDFELNKVYESTKPPSLYPAIFLGRHDGSDGWNYFVDNVYPGDAEPVSYESFTQIKFTGRKEYQINAMSDPIVVVDGELSGYSISRYSTTNPDKYVHRLDFIVRFTGLVLNE